MRWFGWARGAWASGAHGRSGWLPLRAHLAPVRRWRSGALRLYFEALAGAPAPALLELGGASGRNVAFLTGCGHTVYSGDLAQSLQVELRGRDSDAAYARTCVDRMLDFPDHSLDGVLAWEVFQKLAPAVASRVVFHLHRSLKPSGCLFALFDADHTAAWVDDRRFEICGRDVLEASLLGRQRPRRLFHNRAIEELLSVFGTVQVFLAPGSLREAVARR